MTAGSFDFGRAMAILTRNPVERTSLIALLEQVPAAQRATCPKCGSTTVQVVNVEKKNLGAAMLTEALFESTAAGVTVGSKMIPTNTCVSCGFQWLPGSLPEALARLLSGQLGEDNRKKLFAQMQHREQEFQVERRRAQSQRMDLHRCGSGPRRRILGLYHSLLTRCPSACSGSPANRSMGEVRTRTACTECLNLRTDDASQTEQLVRAWAHGYARQRAGSDEA